MAKPLAKKRSRLLISIIIVIVLAAFIGIRSGALKLNFTTSKTGSAEKTGLPKLPSSIINPPKDWEKTTPNTKVGEVGHFESKEVDTEKVESGNLTSNAVIKVKVSSGYKNLDDFVSQYKATGAKNNRFQILSASPVRVSDLDGYLLEINFEAKVGSQNLLVHQLDYLFFKDSLGFLVEGYSSESSWDKHAGEIKSSLDTFRFK